MRRDILSYADDYTTAVFSNSLQVPIHNIRFFQMNGVELLQTTVGIKHDKTTRMLLTSDLIKPYHVIESLGIQM